MPAYIVSYDLKDADSSEYEHLKRVLKIIDPKAVPEQESVWSLTSRIRTAEKLRQKAVGALKILREKEKLSAFRGELLCARVDGEIHSGPIGV